MNASPVGIITGASGGIASGIARRLSADGYCLVLMSRGGCGDLADELGQVGFAGSVLIDDDFERAVAHAVERFARNEAGAQAMLETREAGVPLVEVVVANLHAVRGQLAEFRRFVTDVPGRRSSLWDVLEEV